MMTHTSHNSHLSTPATFLCPQGDRCKEIWLYFELHTQATIQTIISMSSLNFLIYIHILHIFKGCRPKFCQLTEMFNFYQYPILSI